jgi:hypothetical protein
VPRTSPPRVRPPRPVRRSQRPSSTRSRAPDAPLPLARRSYFVPPCCNSGRLAQLSHGIHCPASGLAWFRSLLVVPFPGASFQELRSRSAPRRITQTHSATDTEGRGVSDRMNSRCLNPLPSKHLSAFQTPPSPARSLGDHPPAATGALQPVSP